MVEAEEDAGEQRSFVRTIGSDVWTLKCSRDSAGASGSFCVQWTDTGELFVVNKRGVFFTRSWSKGLSQEFTPSLFMEPWFRYTLQVESEGRDGFTLREWLEEPDKAALFYGSKGWMKGLGSTKGRVPYPAIAQLAVPRRIAKGTRTACVVLSDGGVRFISLPLNSLQGGELAEVKVDVDEKNKEEIDSMDGIGCMCAAWDREGHSLALSIKGKRAILLCSLVYTQSGESAKLSILSRFDIPQTSPTQPQSSPSLSSSSSSSSSSKTGSSVEVWATSLCFASAQDSQEQYVVAGCSDGSVCVWLCTGSSPLPLRVLQSNRANIPVTSVQSEFSQLAACCGNQFTWWHNWLNETSCTTACMEYSFVGMAWTGQDTVVLACANGSLGCWTRTHCDDGSWKVEGVEDGETTTCRGMFYALHSPDSVYKPVAGLCASPCKSMILQVRLENKSKYPVNNQRVKGLFTNMYGIPVHQNLAQTVAAVAALGKPFSFHATAWAVLRLPSLQEEFVGLMKQVPRAHQAGELEPVSFKFNEAFMALSLLLRTAVNKATNRQRRGVSPALHEALQSHNMLEYMQKAQSLWVIDRLDFFSQHIDKLKSEQVAPFALIFCDMALVLRKHGLHWGPQKTRMGKEIHVPELVEQLYQQLGKESDLQLVQKEDGEFPNRSSETVEHMPSIYYDNVTLGLAHPDYELDQRDVRTMQILVDPHALVCVGCGAATSPTTTSWLLPVEFQDACVLCGLPLATSGIATMYLPPSF